MEVNQEPTVASSSHHAGSFGLDLEHYALLARLAIRILVGAEILLCHLINVRVGALLTAFNHAATNLEIAVRVLGINYGQGNARILAHILVLLAPLSGVD